ncbi:PIN domain-containing protein [Aminobacter anthyllidis]|uniref:type II toxin-antitoxin system VapC family toxin n=1 Tax=Aminobacter anthyllidis TaxID=1035067 RepID=UPI002453F748|nr:PIN domain-containing protein [Aminobacter anthyllidis]MDH4987167.1 PIN domain-containing protein [Aminobacter anthyllidis]
MIVVDTSVWIFALRNADRDSVAKLQFETGRGNVLVGDIVLLEILRGARDDRHAAFLEAHLRKYPVVPMMDGRLAPVVAANYRRLRAHGITVRALADIIIATYCIEHGHQLLHDDRDFHPMAQHLGLQMA